MFETFAALSGLIVVWLLIMAGYSLYHEHQEVFQ